MFRFRKKIPEINMKPRTKTVKMEILSVAKPYVEPSHKEIIKDLEIVDNYEAAFLITNLKKEVANLKRKLTILQKKYDGVIKP